MPIHSLAVFCGSKNGNNPVYSTHTAALGKLLAIQKITLIYGGGGKGVMKLLADHVMEEGGTVVGVIPKTLLEREHEHKSISEMIVVDDSMCDAAMALPGGFGTLDEFFEMLTWNQLSIHDKKIFLLNSGGFYEHLILHISKLQNEGFLYETARERIIVLDDPQQLLEHL